MPHYAAEILLLYTRTVGNLMEQLPNKDISYLTRCTPKSHPKYVAPSTARGLRKSIRTPTALSFFYKDTLSHKCQQLALKCLIATVLYNIGNVLYRNSVLSL